MFDFGLPPFQEISKWLCAPRLSAPLCGSAALAKCRRMAQEAGATMCEMWGP